MKLWQAFAAALSLIRHPGHGDHVERVERALRRADLASRRKMAVARRVVEADAQVRDQVEQAGETIRCERTKRGARARGPFAGLATDIEDMLASLDTPRRDTERSE